MFKGQATKEQASESKVEEQWLNQVYRVFCDGLMEEDKAIFNEAVKVCMNFSIHFKNCRFVLLSGPLSCTVNSGHTYLGNK